MKFQVENNVAKKMLNKKIHADKLGFMRKSFSRKSS
jgi:hypothetical protein